MELSCGFNKQAAKVFKVSDTVPLQCWNEIVYDINDEKIGFCKFYMNPEHMKMTIVTHFNHRQRRLEDII